MNKKSFFFEKFQEILFDHELPKNDQFSKIVNYLCLRTKNTLAISVNVSYGFKRKEFLNPPPGAYIGGGECTHNPDLVGWQIAPPLLKWWGGVRGCEAHWWGGEQGRSESKILGGTHFPKMPIISSA